MKNPFIKLVPTVEAAENKMFSRPLASVLDRVPDLIPAETTIVGKAVGQLGKALTSLRSTEASLTAEIAERNERLRQTQLTIRAYERAMAEFAAEDALTDDERKVVGDTIGSMMAGAVAAELKA